MVYIVGWFFGPGDIKHHGTNRGGTFCKDKTAWERERINTIIQNIKTSHICCDDTLILMVSCDFLVKVEDYNFSFLFRLAMTVTVRLSNTTADKRKKVFSSLVHAKCTSIGPCPAAHKRISERKDPLFSWSYRTVQLMSFLYHTVCKYLTTIAFFVICIYLAC